MPQMSDKAHRLSAGQIVDPAYNCHHLFPPPLPQTGWLYPRAEFECFMLLKMRAVTRILKMKVGYTDNLHIPSATATFYRNSSAGDLSMRINGTFQADLDGRPVDFTECGGKVVFQLRQSGKFTISVTVPDVSISLPAIAPDDKDDWFAAAADNVFSPAVMREDPDGEKIPRLDLPMTALGDGKFDACCEIIADVIVRADCKPLMRLGESLFELENSDPLLAEQDLELYETSRGIWQSREPLAFRYVQIKCQSEFDLTIRGCFTPVCYRGAVAADEELNRIWMCATYTQRLCMHHFLLDGIKRDRLPWMGDLALSVLTAAYSFFDAETIRRSLTAIARPGIKHSHLNTVTDYSLWYLITYDNFMLYFGDKEFLSRQYPEIKEHLTVLFSETLPDGRLQQRAGKIGFSIDWVDGSKETALQALYYWSLTAAERIALRMEDRDTADKCCKAAEVLKKTLREYAFDCKTGLFFDTPYDRNSGFHRHANFIALLARLTTEEENRKIIQVLLQDELPQVGTPFMAAFEILALYRGGAGDAALQKIRTVWGGMLKQGATTFFEAWNENKHGNDIYGFYDRPYGLSLCHAWSSGPTFLIPLILSGCEPLADKWRQMRIAPLKDSVMQAVTVPTPYGNVEIVNENGKINVNKPKNISVIYKGGV